MHGDSPFHSQSQPEATVLWCTPPHCGFWLGLGVKGGITMHLACLGFSAYLVLRVEHEYIYIAHHGDLPKYTKYYSYSACILCHGKPVYMTVYLASKYPER